MTPAAGTVRPAVGPERCAAGVRLPPVPAPLGGAADRARAALSKSGAWPVPVLAIECEGDDEQQTDADGEEEGT